jgi:TolB protein
MLAALAPAARAAFPGRNGTIAFVNETFDRASEHSAFNLRTIGGRSLRSCATDSGFCPFSDPAYSPDGARIALAGGSPSQIAALRAGGGGFTLLPLATETDDQPAWSPTGTSLVFRGISAGNADLWLTGVDGTAPSQLTDTPEEEADPAWSFRGVIAYSRNGRLFVLRPGGTPRQVVRGGGRHPSWSPNGRRIAFTRNGAVFTVRASGRRLRRLARGRRPAWSPDGRRIAFIRRKDVYAARADGTRVRRLTRVERGDFAGDVVGAQALDWRPRR